jgi:hypothetical protein
MTCRGRWRSSVSISGISERNVPTRAISRSAAVSVPSGQLILRSDIPTGAVNVAGGVGYCGLPRVKSARFSPISVAADREARVHVMGCHMPVPSDANDYAPHT